LIYPYPQKIAGTQPSFSWKQDERVFSLTFNVTETDTLPTEIYLPSRSWMYGWELTNHGVEISQSFDVETNILSIKPQQPGKVSITIQGKDQ
jgi:hypothetical protein